VPTDIAGVVETLIAVQEVLDKVPPIFHENPVADFNVLYTTITTEIRDRHLRREFADPTFLNLLDVEFGKRYFDALRAWATGTPVPLTWAVLFDRCQDVDLRSLPCAVAGVNAHINYDLPFALLSTWDQVGFMPAGSSQHEDYLLINQVFFDAIPGLRRGYLQRWQLAVDRINGKFDDWYQNLLVELTRARAWDRGVELWRQRADPVAVELARATFDHQAAVVGRVLLSPFCSLLQ
jgi:Family of unknown function (DUF5995)